MRWGVYWVSTAMQTWPGRGGECLEGGQTVYLIVIDYIGTMYPLPLPLAQQERGASHKEKEYYVICTRT
jgi:hypothetical protein